MMATGIPTPSPTFDPVLNRPEDGARTAVVDVVVEVVEVVEVLEVVEVVEVVKVVEVVELEVLGTTSLAVMLK